jgi:predicted nucleotidyltransferase
VNPRKITAALKDIAGERDPNLKAQKLASLVCAVFRARGVELVVVGGSAIEFYTDGAYLSGDIDLCQLKPATTIPLRLRQEIMGQLNAQGGPRSWRVAGLFVDLLGLVEADSRSPLRELAGPYGKVTLISPEELLVERVLVAVYPQANREASACARTLASVALRGQLKLDWNEVKRLAQMPQYRIFAECQQLIREVADEVRQTSPFSPNR